MRVRGNVDVRARALKAYTPATGAPKLEEESLSLPLHSLDCVPALRSPGRHAPYGGPSRSLQRTQLQPFPGALHSS